MNIRPFSGSLSTIPVTDIEKITFSNGNLIVTKNNNTNDPFVISSIRYIDFTNFTLNTPETNLLSKKIYIYPNPVKDYINIECRECIHLINKIIILSLEGKKIFESHYVQPSEIQIDISSLPKGTYFGILNFENKTETIKFIK